VIDSVAKFRIAYRQQLAKLSATRDLAAAPILAKFDSDLAALQADLTKGGKA